MNRNQSFVLLLLLAGLSLALSAPLTLNSAQMADATGCNATATCASKGDACIGDTSKAFACQGGNGSCCAMGLYCISGTCQTDNMGASCGKKSDCYLPSTSIGTSYDCVNGVCSYIYGPGDSCTNSSNCLPGLSCSTNSSTCQGLSAGQGCSFGYNQCAFGLYCALTGMCTTAINNGGACSYSGQCYPGYACIKSTCQPANSQAAGDPCSDALACSGGLTCAANDTCVAVTSSLVSCTASANCTGGTCVCSEVTGNSFCVGGSYRYDPCTSENAALVSCMAQNNCTTMTDAPESCTYANCLSEYKKIFSCSCSLYDSFYGDCYYNQYCGGFPVWAIIVIIVVAIVLVLAIVLLVFFMMRRRRQYDSI